MTQYHSRADGSGTPCTRESHGRCRLCELTDRDGPYYREDYRRLFHPDEFPEAPRIPAPQPRTQPRTTATPHVPLAGDVFAALAARIGADRAAKWVAAKLGAPCGCEERRRKMNELDMKLRKWFGL